MSTREDGKLTEKIHVRVLRCLFDSFEPFFICLVTTYLDKHGFISTSYLTLIYMSVYPYCDIEFLGKKNMQIFVVTREASKVKTLDIDTSDSIEVIKAFIDLKIGVESSQQRWAVMESEKIPSWLGRLGSTIYNMVGSVSDMVGIPIGKKNNF